MRVNVPSGKNKYFFPFAAPRISLLASSLARRLIKTLDKFRLKSTHKRTSKYLLRYFSFDHKTEFKWQGKEQENPRRRNCNDC